MSFLGDLAEGWATVATFGQYPALKEGAKAVWGEATEGPRAEIEAPSALEESARRRLGEERIAQIYAQQQQLAPMLEAQALGRAPMVGDIRLRQAQTAAAQEAARSAAAGLGPSRAMANRAAMREAAMTQPELYRRGMEAVGREQQAARQAYAEMLAQQEAGQRGLQRTGLAEQRALLDAQLAQQQFEADRAMSEAEKTQSFLGAITGGGARIIEEAFGSAGGE